VLFPHGQYTINSTLTMPGLIKGEGNALLRMASPDKDMFYAMYVWRLRIENMRFVGGRNQLHLGTNDIDCAFWVVRDCVFSQAAGAAIRVIDRGDPNTPPKYVGSQSTQMTIDASQFFNNEQVVVWKGDTLTVNDVWVEGFGHNKSYDKAWLRPRGSGPQKRFLGPGERFYICPKCMSSIQKFIGPQLIFEGPNRERRPCLRTTLR
jgi:hypothetical protein